MKKTVLIILVLAALFNVTVGQVTISPTSLFFDSKQRFQTLVIINGSNAAQEVNMSWQFGYPLTDSQGNITMVYDDSLRESQYSAADWINGFPKRFILEAGSRQTIRVTVKAPRDLEDGTYWSRMIVESAGVSAPIGEVATSGIRTQINLNFKQITSVFYKHGDTYADLQVTDITNSVEDQKLTVIASYQRRGNSPYLGTMKVKIYDVLDDLVKEQFLFVSAYFDGKQRMEIDVSDLPMGSYDVEVSFTGSRGDIPDSDIISGNEVVSRGSFTKI